MSLELWKNSLNEAVDVLQKFLSDKVALERCEALTSLIVKTVQSQGNLFTCGNGGSHCDAMHFAEEWTGRFQKDRRAVGALALGDASHMSCVGNDFGFESVFERQIEGLGRRGDLLIGISTSGNSKNVARALQAAKSKGLATAALLGRDGGVIKNLVDLPIVVSTQSTERIQEMHIKIIHNLIYGAERILFPDNYRG